MKLMRLVLSQRRFGVLASGLVQTYTDEVNEFAEAVAAGRWALRRMDSPELLGGINADLAEVFGMSVPPVVHSPMIDAEKLRALMEVWPGRLEFTMRRLLDVRMAEFHGEAEWGKLEFLASRAFAQQFLAGVRARLMVGRDQRLPADDLLVSVAVGSVAAIDRYALGFAAAEDVDRAAALLRVLAAIRRGGCVPMGHYPVGDGALLVLTGAG
jgi:hypothetical protein